MARAWSGLDRGQRVRRQGLRPSGWKARVQPCPAAAYSELRTPLRPLNHTTTQVLPLSVYGAIAMTQLPAESEQTPGMVSSRQFFIYKVRWVGWWGGGDCS